MSTMYNPAIVLNGLVLSLDAGNIKSYPGAGTAWTDISGLGNTATLTGGPTFNGANGGSIVFDGVNDYTAITCASSSLIRSYNSTIQFVIKKTTYSGSQQNIISYRNGGGSLYIGSQSGGIFCYDSSLNTPAYTVGSITDGTIAFVHVVCDATGTTLSVYINGALAGSVTRTGWSTSYNTSLVIGGSDLEYMTGNFYCFSHYNRVLTATEIGLNYRALRGRFGL